MTLGLDGKLYFTHGDGCCSFEQSTGRHDAKNFDVVDKSGRHVSSDQLANTLRVNRDGTQFEIIADRQRNYETSLNSFGNIFTSDNDDDGNRGSRVIWVMDGGKYGYRTPGSPRHWVPSLGALEAWIVDETGWIKQGHHSVGVSHQYCGSVGKQANCQVCVEVAVSDGEIAAPAAGRLYLPQSWTEDRSRCRAAGVPQC